MLTYTEVLQQISEITVNKIKTLFSKKITMGIAIFIAAVLVLQGIALLTMTPNGLSLLYPYVLAAKSDKITTGDAGIGEYFSLHKDIEDAGAVVLFIEPDVEDSYKLASDYLGFLSKFTRISSAAVYTMNSRVRSISDAALGGDYNEFAKKCDNQRRSKTFSDQFFLFLEKVYSMNTRLTPDNKISIVGFKGHDDLKDILNEMTNDLFSSAGGLGGEHTAILDSRTPEEYSERLMKHESALRGFLGDKAEKYFGTIDVVMSGNIEETYAVKNLVKYSPAEEGTVFIVAPRYLADKNGFVEKIEENYGKTVVTNTAYYDCITLENKEELPLNDGAFPGIVTGIRIATAEKLADFREYYGKVCNSFDSDKLAERMNVIGDAGERAFFIISGSGPVTFEQDKKESVTQNTVLVAPGQ